MRAIRRAVPAVLLGAAVLALVAHPPPAGARPDGAPPREGNEAFRAYVIPAVSAPGGRVTLSTSGCLRDATASSGVFDTVALHPHGGAVAVAVDADARPAEYRVRFVCADGSVHTVPLTVTGGPRGDGPPRHGVRAGVGGSLGDFDLQQIAVGVLLLAGAFALALRRSRQHRTETPERPGAPAATDRTAP